jgi:hypothetical protein
MVQHLRGQTCAHHYAPKRRRMYSMGMYTLRPSSPNGDRQDQSTVSGTVAVKRTSVLYHRYVPGFASERFTEYRRKLFQKFARLGYEAQGRVLNASWFGVPQLRPHFVLVAFQGSASPSCGDSSGQEPVVCGPQSGSYIRLRGIKGLQDPRNDVLDCRQIPLPGDTHLPLRFCVS